MSAITVVDAGPLTTIQDGGRPGYAHLGVPASGALDPPALARANALVGNRQQAAGLECTVRGPTLRFGQPARFAVTGAPAPVLLNGAAVSHGEAQSAGAGDVLEVGLASDGVRSYIGLAGGVAVPETLGSRSTDTLSGLGPAPLMAGQSLPLGSDLGWGPAPPPTAPHSGALRLHLGPRDDWFAPEAVERLRAEPFTVSPTSNRIGLRLTGPELAYASDTELRSEGLVLGAIQVPPNGQPIVMLADHPTTGGYPVIGVVAAADLPLLAQLRPGAQLRFALA